MLIVCYKTYEKINTFSSPPSELSPLLSSVYTFFVYLFIHSLFVCFFFFFSQSAKQPVSKTPHTYFRKAEEFGVTTWVPA